MRVKVTLACTECKQRNYNTVKNKKNDPDRVELKKYCPFLQKTDSSQRNEIRRVCNGKVKTKQTG